MKRPRIGSSSSLDDGPSWKGPARLLREHYLLEDKIASGSFGIVYRARRKADNMRVAVKAFIKHSALELNGFQLGTFREISAALRINHPSFVHAVEVCIDPATRPLTAFLVLDYAEHELGTLLRMKKRFTLSEKKCLIIQLLSAVQYLSEELGLAHRDIKPGNLLYTNTGHLKICDFGSCRPLAGSTVWDIDKEVEYRTASWTEHIGTLWYESPESLMELQNYIDLPPGCMDMWASGCVIHEILMDDFSEGPLFKSSRTKTEILNHILSSYDVMNNWPELLDIMEHSKVLLSLRFPFQSENRSSLMDRSGHSDITKDFLLGMLEVNPSKRLTAREALKHPFLTQDRPLPQKISFMPSFEETNQRRVRS